MSAPVRRLQLVRDLPGRPGMDRAGEDVSGLVRDVAVTRYGAHVGERRVPGFEFGRRDVGPLEGLRAARLVRRCAERSAAGYVADARADGLSWAAIAQACGLRDEGGPGLVFADAAGSVYGHITYRCTACGGLVEDYGPEYGPPEASVDGHVVGCRLLGR